VKKHFIEVIRNFAKADAAKREAAEKDESADENDTDLQIRNVTK